MRERREGGREERRERGREERRERGREGGEKGEREGITITPYIHVHIDCAQSSCPVSTITITV